MPLTLDQRLEALVKKTKPIDPNLQEKAYAPSTDIDRRLEALISSREKIAYPKAAPEMLEAARRAVAGEEVPEETIPSVKIGNIPIAKPIRKEVKEVREEEFRPYEPSEPPMGGKGVPSPYGTFIEGYSDLARAFGVPFERINLAVAAPAWKMLQTATPYAKKAMTWVMIERQAAANTAGLGKEAKQNEMDRLKLLFPELKEKVDTKALRELPTTLWNAAKALIPLPGMTKDTENVAQIASKYYKEMTGEKPPFWYGGAMDFASMIAATEGIRAGARFLAGFTRWAKGKPASQVRPARAEVNAALKNYQETGDRTQWDAVRIKYAGITPEGVERIRARTAPPPPVKEFGKYPLGKPIEPPFKTVAPAITKAIPEPTKPVAPRKPAEPTVTAPEAVIEAPAKPVAEKQPWERTKEEFENEYRFHGTPFPVGEVKAGSYFTDYQTASYYAWRSGKSESRIYAVRKSELKPDRKSVV